MSVSSSTRRAIRKFQRTLPAPVKRAARTLPARVPHYQTTIPPMPEWIRAALAPRKRTPKA